MRRIISIILFAVMLTSLSACGGEGQPNTSNTPMDDDAAAATAILEEAVARRETIQTSKTQIVWDEALIPGKTYTGTAYYVSNQGDDGNDGLSPETAWSTLDRVNQASLEYGDAVFLERGGVWRAAWAEEITVHGFRTTMSTICITPAAVLKRLRNRVLNPAASMEYNL